MENINRVHYRVIDDRLLIINEIANSGIIINILHYEHGVTIVPLRCVSHLLTSEQKWTEMINLLEKLTLCEIDSHGFLERFLT